MALSLSPKPRTPKPSTDSESSAFFFEVRSSSVPKILAIRILCRWPFSGTLPLPYFGFLIPERPKGLCDGFFGEFLRDVHVLGFESLGFRVQGLGFRVWMSGDLDTRVLSASLHTDVMLKLNRSSKQSLHRDRKRANANFSFMQGLRFGERSLVLLTWFKQALTELSRRRLWFYPGRVKRLQAASSFGADTLRCTFQRVNAHGLSQAASTPSSNAGGTSENDYKFAQTLPFPPEDLRRGTPCGTFQEP